MTLWFGAACLSPIRPDRLLNNQIQHPSAFRGAALSAALPGEPIRAIVGEPFAKPSKQRERGSKPLEWQGAGLRRPPRQTAGARPRKAKLSCPECGELDSSQSGKRDLVREDRRARAYARIAPCLAYLGRAALNANQRARPAIEGLYDRSFSRPIGNGCPEYPGVLVDKRFRGVASRPSYRHDRRWNESPCGKYRIGRSAVDRCRHHDPCAPRTTTRRALIIGLGAAGAAAAALPFGGRLADAGRPATIRQPAKPSPRAFMAMAEAMRALAIRTGDQSFGAVVVKANRVVGLGPSRVIVDTDPTAHAEDGGDPRRCPASGHRRSVGLRSLRHIPPLSHVRDRRLLGQHRQLRARRRPDRGRKAPLPAMLRAPRIAYEKLATSHE